MWARRKDGEKKEGKGELGRTRRSVKVRRKGGELRKDLGRGRLCKIEMKDRQEDVRGEVRW